LVLEVLEGQGGSVLELGASPAVIPIFGAVPLICCLLKAVTGADSIMVVRVEVRLLA